jgi:hypothetical protein
MFIQTLELKRKIRNKKMRRLAGPQPGASQLFNDHGPLFLPLIPFPTPLQVGFPRHLNHRISSLTICWAFSSADSLTRAIYVKPKWVQVAHR